MSGVDTEDGERFDAVIIGAGLAGISAAFHLSRGGMHKVAVVDPRAPLSLTSDKSTECYRNWWPGPGNQMVRLMDRSIDLLDGYSAESGDAFHLNRRGYLYATADQTTFAELEREARSISRLGAGEVRTHTGLSDSYRPATPNSWDPDMTGADLLDGPGVRRHFPALGHTTVGAMHIRRAGWFSAHQLGTWMLGESRRSGTRFIQSAAVEVRSAGGRIAGVVLADGTVLKSQVVVQCTGPMISETMDLVGEAIPVRSELHLKVSFKDFAGAIPRDSPMLIWNDHQTLDWSEEERVGLLEFGRKDLAAELPRYCHARPEGGPDSNWVVALWEYHKTVITPTWPLPRDELYPEIVIRGLARMLPAMDEYRDRIPFNRIDGGYYTKTPDNRPVVGPASTPGVYVVGALSGFGVMAACAAGELLAGHVLGSALPDYASAFTLDRFDDANYLESITETGGQGQL